MAVQAGLCHTWSEIPKTGFLASRLKSFPFQALDYSASHRISLRDALLLFKEIHGDKFSLTTWHHFLSSRDSPDDNVYFDEIRFWLCSTPEGKPCSDKELKEEENKILMRQHDYAYNQYSFIQRELVRD